MDHEITNPAKKEDPVVRKPVTLEEKLRLIKELRGCTAGGPSLCDMRLEDRRLEREGELAEEGWYSMRVRSVDDKRGILRFICFGVIGVLYQSMSLTAFMFVADTRFAEVGKPLVVGASMLASALLVWIWIRSIERARWIFMVPALLAVGYSVAFQLVGLVFFPGLVGDFYPPFLDYAIALPRVTGNVFVLFGIGTALIFLLQRWTARHDFPFRSEAHLD